MATDIGTALVIAGVLVGVLLRSLLPYLKKASEMEKAGQKISFAPKYIATTLLSLIGAAFTALQVISIIDIPEVEGVQSIASVFIAAVVYAFAFQSTLNVVAETKAS
jgi:hypothetical protein